MLSELRPSKHTDVAALDRMIAAGGRDSAMPSRLPDEVLLSLARDFREVAQTMAGESEPANMAPPLLLVLRLLGERPGMSRKTKLTVTESQLARSMQVVQVAVEREILARITGVPAEEVDEWLSCALDEACRA